MFLILSLNWRSHAHNLIANIAAQGLHKSESVYIRKIMSAYDVNTKSFEDDSVWHDNLITKNRLTIMKTFHFDGKPFIDGVKEPIIPPPTYNITSYIKSAWKTLNDPTTTDMYIIGFHLRSLTHFVGDIHTPHHNIARYSRDTPNGDYGGNYYIIKTDNCSICKNIHALWDFVCLDLIIYNISKENEKYQESIDKYLTEYPNKYDVSFNPELWHNESYRKARKIGYKTPYDRHVSSKYMRKCRIHSSERVAMAAYRLQAIYRYLFDKGILVSDVKHNIYELIPFYVNSTCICILFMIHVVPSILSIYYNLKNQRKLNKTDKKKIQ